MTRLHVTLLSPYHGGSHQAWAEGLRHSSGHQVEILSLPASFWKWRMHGGAITLAGRFRREVARTDLIMATDMVDLTTFLALVRERLSGVPSLLYAHENQLTYPLPEDGSTGPMRRQMGERDRHYAFVNFASMLVADRICFNSRYHRDEFLAGLPAFLSHYPDEKDEEWIGTIARKSTVLAPGIDLRRLDSQVSPSDRGRAEGGSGTSSSESREMDSGSPPLIVWNQRWEYDKDPGAFFRALDQVAALGRDFRLAVCGSNPRQLPAEFLEARDRLGSRVVHWGFADDLTYGRLLRDSALTVSTARHEFFGIGVCEAMYCGNCAILPARLNYPDLIPVKLHDRCLYSSPESLVERLLWALDHPEEAREVGEELRAAALPYDWTRLIGEYDRLLEEVTRERVSP